MKSLQMRYNAMQMLFWFASCAMMGYIAVFLGYKGLTNTQIGIASGGACLANIVMSPWLSSFLKIKWMTIKKLMTGVLAMDMALYFLISVLPLPAVVIIPLYIITYSLNVSCVPFLSTVCMDYIRAGRDVNFGLARGLGSVSYAISAVLMGVLIKRMNATVLPIVYAAAFALFILVLVTMPKVEEQEEDVKKPESSVGKIIKEYPVFFRMLLGWTFSFAAATALATYLIDIVTSLGGDTSLYGVAVFCMAASELPIMALSPLLMKRFNSILLLMIAGFFYIVRNVTICLAPSLLVLMIGMACQSFSYALFTGVITYYVTYHLKDEDQVMGQTMIAIMSTGCGSMIGNVAGGVITDAFGLQAMLACCIVMTLIGAAIMMMTGLSLGKTLLKKDCFSDM